MPVIHQPRRRDRAVTDEAWIKSMLRRQPTCVLALSAGDQPSIHVSLFAYDEAAGAIYLHTAREGRTRAGIEANPRVCLCVHEMGRLLPARTALNMSVEYASVIVFGRAIVVSDEDEARRGLQRLLDKYFTHLEPGRDYRPITGDELTQTAVYRVDIEAWSGKRKQVEADFPGAFVFGSKPA